MQSNDNNKNRGTHGDSSFMLGGLPSSSENPPASAVGSVKNYNGFFESLTNPDAPASTVREAVLAKAKAAVCGERDEQYGTPEDNFETIAEYWSLYLGIELEALDVANMMILLKLARLGSGAPTLDSYVDIAGYAACGAEIADKENRPSLAFYRVTPSEDERG